mgnify:CR=1 FL=1
MVVIVDYGMGNLGSIRNMLSRLGGESIVTADANVIAGARRLILPGVGAFDVAMERLKTLSLVEVLHERALGACVPVLGICLGMQLMTRGSEEGRLPGLGWFDAETIRFRFPQSCGKMRLPHMGWNVIRPMQGHPLLKGLDDEPRFYFVHNYHVRCTERAQVLATAQYGITFDAAVATGNIIGTQFHPEKSHRHGMRMLANFLAI